MPETHLRPLAQLRADMLQAMQLSSAVEQCTSAYLPPDVVQVEMQLSAILAQMEIDGMGKPPTSCDQDTNACTAVAIRSSVLMLCSMHLLGHISKCVHGCSTFL